MTIDERLCILCGKKRSITDFPLRADQQYKYRRGECRFCINKRTRLKWKELRQEILDHYGRKCVCCGETIEEFLSIDHINNDGFKDKNPNGDKKSGKELYLLIKKQGFPDKYQILCMNCNWGKKIGNGVCPHKKYGKY